MNRGFEFVNAQFSVKFPQQVEIRRYVNEIEDVLKEDYTTPQIFPVPDNFAADAPRLSFTSNGNHSQIAISQISIDLNVNFDNDFATDFAKTKEYINNKVKTIAKILDKAKIERYYFCGLVYSYSDGACVDEPKEFMQKALEHLGKATGESLYDASWRKTYIDGDYFINERADIGRKFDGIGNVSSLLFNFVNSKVVEEKIINSIDVNNRARYIREGTTLPSDTLHKQMQLVIDKIENIICGDR